MGDLVSLFLHRSGILGGAISAGGGGGAAPVDDPDDIIGPTTVVSTGSTNEYAWSDFRMSDCYQDTAGTVPVTANGQPIGSFLIRGDSQVAGALAVAYNASNLGTWHTDGTLTWVQGGEGYDFGTIVGGNTASFPNIGYTLWCAVDDTNLDLSAADSNLLFVWEGNTGALTGVSCPIRQTTGKLALFSGSLIESGNLTWGTGKRLMYLVTGSGGKGILDQVQVVSGSTGSRKAHGVVRVFRSFIEPSYCFCLRGRGDSSLYDNEKMHNWLESQAGTTVTWNGLY